MHFVYSKIINTMKALVVLCKSTARQTPWLGCPNLQEVHTA